MLILEVINLYIYTRSYQKKKIDIVFFGQTGSINKLKLKLRGQNFYYHKFNSIVSNNHNFVRYNLLLLLWNYFIVLKNYFTLYKIIKKSNLKILLVSDDRSPDVLLSLIRICKKKSIKVILIPSGIFSAKKFVVQNRMKNLDNFLCKEKDVSYNKFFVKVKKKYLSFYRKDILPIYKHLEMLPKNPWVSGSNVDQVIFQSNSSKRYYIKAGIDKNKIKELKLKSPVKAKVKKNVLQVDNFYKKYKITNNKRIIFYHPMLWYEHNITDKKEHIKRNYQTAEIIHKNIQNSDVECLITLHPKQKKIDYIWLNKKFNFKIIDEKLYDVISFCSLYLVNYESDTMLWAADLKIECLVTNFFKEKSKEFKADYLRFPNTKNKFNKMIKQALKKKKLFYKNYNQYNIQQDLIANHLSNIIKK